MPDIAMTPGNRDPKRYAKKTTLSLAMVALIAAGAQAPELLEQFAYEKEGSRLSSYLDGAKIWTICGGLTRYQGKPVTANMKLSAAECRVADKEAFARALREAEEVIGTALWNTLSEAAKTAFADMVHNLGKAKFADTTAVRELKAGRRNEACAAITLWIRDGGKDCRKGGSGCQGQPIRRMQEDELCLTGDAQ